jgi:hypothetical protein
MSCHLCSRELEFSEIAGFNPNLPAESDDRTNYTMINNLAEPICDNCYWSNPDDAEDYIYENEEIEETEEEGEAEEEEDYTAIYCIDCGEVIEGITLEDFSDDDEAAAASTSYKCDECIGINVNPSTPELNESPSDEEPPPPSPVPSSYQP